MSALRRFVPIAAAAALALAAPGALAPAAAQTELLPEDRAVLRSEVRRYLLEHPEIILEAMEVLEQRRREAETMADRDLIARLETDIFEDGFSFVAGNPDGDVTVVEFLDYNCGFCKRAHDAVRELVETDPGIRYVVKEFPILGPTSTIASQAAIAAMAQEEGRLYMPFNDALMRHRGVLTEADVFAYAADVGLDVDRLRADMQDEAIIEKLAATRALAQRLRIEGTPSFVIGGQLVRGYVPLERMRDVVAEERG